MIRKRRRKKTVHRRYRKKYKRSNFHKRPFRAKKRTRKIRKRTTGQRIRTHSDIESKKPNGTVLSIKDWIRSSPVHRRRLDSYFKEFHQEKISYYAEAKGLERRARDDFRSQNVRSLPTFVAVIKGGRVWGRDGAVITPDNRLLADVSWEFTWDFVRENRHSLFRHWKPHPIRTTAETIGVLCHTSSENYFHWMYDVLPRIDLLRRSGRLIDKYLIAGSPQPYQEETLNMMGIAAAHRIYTYDQFHMQARRLVVPSLVSRFGWSKDHYPLPVTYSKWACEFVRDELSPHRNIQDSGSYERVYVSRALAKNRRLTNEEEIFSRLAPLGFTAIQAETMPVRDQIDIFAAAKVIVAPHGAGLANVAFCSPGTKVVELFSPIYTPGYFWILSNHFGLDYHYLIGDGYYKNSWAGAADFYVNPDHLDRLLQNAGIT